MKKLRLEKDYRNDKELCRSFCGLAKEIFGLDFERWQSEGFWNERYIPYSFVEGSRVVANVSVNKVDLLIEGKKHRSLQIGTVMTHPEYRQKGLSGKLMSAVLRDFEGQYDIMYLFANDSVMEFYPKFGFRQVAESDFFMPFKSEGRMKGTLRKLEMDNPADLAFVAERVEHRVPVSRSFGTSGTPGITMYHCQNVFQDAIYYCETLDAIILFTGEGDSLDLVDVIASAPVRLEDAVHEIAGEHIRKVRLHFTPDSPACRMKSGRQGALFVRTNGIAVYPENMKHPLTSEA